MRRNGYYKQDWVPEGIDPNILEQRFGQTLEPGAKVAFEKLLAWEEDLSLQEWALIMIYIEVQRLRVPRQANAAKELLRSFILLHGSPSATEAVLKAKLTLRIADSFRFDFLKMMTGSLVRYFMRMQWEIVRSDDAAFITTDNPVSLFNIAVKPPDEPGIGLAGTILLFPLNPHRLLMLRHPELLDESLAPDDPVPEPTAPQEGIAVNERITWPAEQARRHNSLMIEGADRLIVAGSKEALEAAVGRKLNGH